MELLVRAGVRVLHRDARAELDMLAREAVHGARFG
jgi:hypothetical protein